MADTKGVFILPPFIRKEPFVFIDEVTQIFLIQSKDLPLAR